MGCATIPPLSRWLKKLARSGSSSTRRLSRGDAADLHSFDRVAKRCAARSGRRAACHSRRYRTGSDYRRRFRALLVAVLFHLDRRALDSLACRHVVGSDRILFRHLGGARQQSRVRTIWCDQSDRGWVFVPFVFGLFFCQAAARNSSLERGTRRRGCLFPRAWEHWRRNAWGMGLSHPAVARSARIRERRRRPHLRGFRFRLGAFAHHTNIVATRWPTTSGQFL